MPPNYSHAEKWKRQECAHTDGNCEGRIRLTPLGWLCGWHAATLKETRHAD